MKLLLSAVLLMTTSLVFAQVSSREVIRLSYDVSRYLEVNSSAMGKRELSEVASQLNRILDGRSSSGHLRAICTPDYNKLRTLEGIDMAVYSSPFECQKGLKQFKEYGVICTPDYNILKTFDGIELAVYSSQFECLKALEQL